MAAELLRRIADRFHAPELNERFCTSGLFKTRAVSRLTRLTIASGVRAGANIAIMEINSYPGKLAAEVYLAADLVADGGRGAMVHH